MLEPGPPEPGWEVQPADAHLRCRRAGTALARLPAVRSAHRLRM